MMTISRVAPGIGLVAALLAASPLAAQNSAYGVLGIGFPSVPFGVVARSMGGGPSAVDPQSFINPGAIGMVNTLFVQAASMQEFRNYTIGPVNATGLKQNRFPYLGVSGPVGSRLAYFVGFGSYAERTYDIVTSDTVVLRGTPVGVSDHTGSSGGIADIRAAVAWTRTPRLSFGVSAHVITGSAKVTTRREFTDPLYRNFSETVDAGYSGYGVSGGVVYSPRLGTHVGASIRVDGKLDREIARQDVGDVTLPVAVSAGGEYRASPMLRLAATTTWRSWANAGPDIGAGTSAFNTLDAGFGIEIGGTPNLGPPVPLRLGVRYATLPFSPTTDQPRELSLTAGTGLLLSGGRARIDLSAERVMRDGGGATERSWQFTAGFHVRP